MKKYIISVFLLLLTSTLFANEYYTPPASVSAASRARSSKINEIISSVDSGFDNIPVNLQGQIDALVAGSGVVISSNDTTVGYLNDKFLVGDIITKAINSPGGSETLTITIPDASIPTVKMQDDSITYTKIQNIVSDDVFLGNDSGIGSIVEEITMSVARSMLNIENGADVTDAVNIASSIAGVTGKTTPVDADTIPLVDSADSSALKQLTWANLKATIKAYYDSVTSTFTNKTFDADGSGNSLTNIEDANIKAGAAINAAKIADGTVSDTEYQYINTLSSNAQTQIDSKATLTIETAVASTSGTEIDFLSLPANIKRITISFAGVSTNGTSSKLIQIGDAGDVETTGYGGSATLFADSTAVTSADFTAGFGILSIEGVNLVSGSVVLTLLDPVTNTWTASGTLADMAGGGSTKTYITAGSKSLSAELDRVRITTSNGSDTFDAGKINITYE